MCVLFLEKVHKYHQALKKFHNSRKLRTVVMNTERTKEASIKHQVRRTRARVFFLKNPQSQTIRNQAKPRWRGGDL